MPDLIDASATALDAITHAGRRPRDEDRIIMVPAVFDWSRSRHIWNV